MHPPHGFSEFIPEMTHIEATQAAKLDTFHRGPDAPVRIELRGIAEEPCQMHSFCRPVPKKLFDRVATLNRCPPIPDNDHSQALLAAGAGEGRQRHADSRQTVAGPQRKHARGQPTEEGLIRRLPTGRDAH